MSKVAGLHLWYADLEGAAIDLILTTPTKDIVKATLKAQKTLDRLKQRGKFNLHRQDVTLKGVAYQGTIDA